MPDGVILGIAFRPSKGDPMQLIEECAIVTGRGLQLENRQPGKRCVTLLSIDAWTDTCRALAADLPWQTRRANLLVKGLDLERTVGKPLQIGNVRLWIHAETKPCQLMDTLHHGLKSALVPDFRGGVYGQALSDGLIRTGETVKVDDAHS